MAAGPMKMRATLAGGHTEVRAIAQAGGKSYVATKEIKVTIGGCGG